MHAPQIRVAGMYRVLLSPPGADDEHVVSIDGHNAPEFLDQVGIKVAVDCGPDVSGVKAREKTPRKRARRTA